MRPRKIVRPKTVQHALKLAYFEAEGMYETLAEPTLTTFADPRRANRRELFPGDMRSRPGPLLRVPAIRRWLPNIQAGKVTGRLSASQGSGLGTGGKCWRGYDSFCAVKLKSVL